MILRVVPLEPIDRSTWEVLARGYKEFYSTVISDSDYEMTWNRLLLQDGVYGVGAKVDGQLVGICHYLFHTSAWATTVCYLQDLFVSPASRGRGVARSLIEHVAESSRARGALRMYWLTQEHNAAARDLYDKVAKFNGFIRYDFPL